MAVRNVETAAAFYESTLELPVVRDRDVATVTVGQSTLVLRSGRVGPGSHHLAFTVPATQFPEAKRWLADRVPLMEHNATDEFALPAPWRSQSVYFLGPDDILLELIARQRVSSTAPLPFSSANLLSVSEVGLAVDDAEAAAATLCDTLGLDRFGSGGADFAPVGDHQGLLIVVAVDRVWFPTTDQIPSREPLSITLDPGGQSPPRPPLQVGSSTLRSTDRGGRPGKHWTLTTEPSPERGE